MTTGSGSNTGIRSQLAKMEADCPEHIRRVIQQIWSSTEFSSARTTEQVRQEIARVGELCGELAASYLEIELRAIQGDLTVGQAAHELETLLRDDALPPYLAIRLHVSLARLRFDPRDTSRADEPHRRKAIKIADEHGFALEALVANANWFYSLTARQEFKEAHDSAASTRERLQSLPPSTAKHPLAAEVRARSSAVEAQLLLRESVETERPVRDVLPTVIERYEEAIRADPSNAHRRMNTPTELANILAALGPLYWRDVKDSVDAAIEQAKRAYSAHPCNKCRAYFHQTVGTRDKVAGLVEYRTDINAANATWQHGIIECETSIALYDEIKHPFIVEPTKIKRDIEELLKMAEKPRKIFLSHKGADKPLVRDFKTTLELLRYEPWLDEDAMTAGVPLDRSILQGMKDSCGVVFFITSSFRDESFLAAEINYAVAEKRKRSDFTIVTLVFMDNSGNAPSVPELLEPYVYKSPDTRLAALREIIQAVPLKPANPEWTEVLS